MIETIHFHWNKFTGAFPQALCQLGNDTYIAVDCLKSVSCDLGCCVCY
jgi:hypothetical protein